MVLYHAISSYQLLEVMLHRYWNHRKEKAILILPDFIQNKYPKYHNLEKKKFFDKVILFPYTKIPHDGEEEIFRSVKAICEKQFPYKLSEFHKIYVAGAHFYFSLYLIKMKIPFIFFEDAAGILSHPEILREGLQRKYPVQEKIAVKYGLFTGENRYITSVICMRKAQAKSFRGKRYVNFSVEDALKSLSFWQLNRFRSLFLSKKIRTNAQVIVLTQQFANLGIMTQKEQEGIYCLLYERKLKDYRLLVKTHPDDRTDYHRIFHGAQVIHEIFPSEFLPYVFYKSPQIVCTLTSTSIENLQNFFTIWQIPLEELQ